MGRSTDQFCNLRRRVAGHDERLPDEHGVIAGSVQRTSVSLVTDTGLGNFDHAIRNQRRHPDRSIVIDFKGDEVALIDTDQRRISAQCRIKFKLVMNLDHHIETQFSRQ